MDWKPQGWIAVLLGLLLQPFAFLYVNNAGLFWRYLVLSLLVSGLDFLVHRHITPDSWLNSFYLSWVFALVCAFHAYRAAVTYNRGQDKRWYTRWWAIPAIFTGFYGPVFLFRAFVYEPFSIPARSMSPTINVGDHIIVRKWGFGGYGTYNLSVINSEVSSESLLQRGNIYVFYPPDITTPYVKRLIGLPGDTIEINGDVIRINGDLLRSEYLYDDGDKKIYREILAGQNYLIQRSPDKPVNVYQTIKLRPQQYFFLGDNRDNSRDSRFWGTVSVTDFVGEVVVVF